MTFYGGLEFTSNLNATPTIPLQENIPCIRSAVKNLASLAKPGQARFSGFLAKLTGKMRPGKAWQAWPRPSFLGNLGHKSPAFLAILIPRPDFLGNLGQKKKKEAFLVAKMLARLSRIFWHWKVVVRNLALFSWSEIYWLFLLILSKDRDIKETLPEVTTRCFILSIINVSEVTIKSDSSASHILKDFTWTEKFLIVLNVG